MIDFDKLQNDLSRFGLYLEITVRDGMTYAKFYSSCLPEGILVFGIDDFCAAVTDIPNFFTEIKEKSELLRAEGVVKYHGGRISYPDGGSDAPVIYHAKKECVSSAVN